MNPIKSEAELRQDLYDIFFDGHTGHTHAKVDKVVEYITNLTRQHEREIADNLIDQEGKLYKIYQDDEKIMIGIKIMADEVREYYDGGIYTKN